MVSFIELNFIEFSSKDMGISVGTNMSFFISDGDLDEKEGNMEGFVENGSCRKSLVVLFPSPSIVSLRIGDSMGGKN